MNPILFNKSDMNGAQMRRHDMNETIQGVKNPLVKGYALVCKRQ